MMEPRNLASSTSRKKNLKIRYSRRPKQQEKSEIDRKLPCTRKSRQVHQLLTLTRRNSVPKGILKEFNRTSIRNRIRTLMTKAMAKMTKAVSPKRESSTPPKSRSWSATYSWWGMKKTKILAKISAINRSSHSLTTLLWRHSPQCLLMPRLRCLNWKWTLKYSTNNSSSVRRWLTCHLSNSCNLKRRWKFKMQWKNRLNSHSEWNKPLKKRNPQMKNQNWLKRNSLRLTRRSLRSRWRKKC